MNTRILMTATAAVLVLAGLAATFAPQELLATTGVHSAAAAVLVQLLGAALLGLGIADWTAKDSQIGGIYNRPLALGNLLHFVTGAFAIGRFAIAAQTAAALVAAVVYIFLALAFGFLLFGK